MKQLSAVQGLLKARVGSCCAGTGDLCRKAMQEGRTAEIVDELMETLKFDKQVFRPRR